MSVSARTDPNLQNLTHTTFGGASFTRMPEDWGDYSQQDVTAVASEVLRQLAIKDAAEG
jgi:hypothetical protein